MKKERITKGNVTLVPLDNAERERFIIENQYAFKYGATEEFGCRDERFEEDGEIISRKTIENSINGGTAYTIRLDGEFAGGAVVKIDSEAKKGELELLFVLPDIHGRGIGQTAWFLIEEMYPEIDVWETCTPYFETRNIHFYINRCGFAAVEFYCKYNPDPHDYGDDEGEKHKHGKNEDFDGMFRFEKRIHR